MQYFIIERVECIDNQLMYTTLGYVNDEAVANDLNARGYNSLLRWIEENAEDHKNQLVHLEDCQHLPCIACRMSTNNISAADLQPYEVDNGS